MRMSWTADRNMAVELSARQTRYGRTWLYEATVRRDAVLAYLERRGEGWTVVINPAGLSQIKRLEELLPRSPRSEVRAGILTVVRLRACRFRAYWRE
jgi:hypothetical protein